ncbi:MAG: hypothetical protein JXD18_01070 [Anaerolineae bacterium]|nr:hypothetical protein [Anaerolineae bacterium]
MIVIARAPVRFDLGGNGLDFPSLNQHHIDSVALTASVDYYTYTILSPRSSDDVKLTSADCRALCHRPKCEDMIWNLPRAVVSYFNLCGGIDIFQASQTPPGTGLGTARSATVSLVKALSFWCGLDIGAREVAELACHIERDAVGMPVSQHDHYAAAFGGINLISATKNKVSVDRLALSQETLDRLEAGLMLFLVDASCQPIFDDTRNRTNTQRASKLIALKELGLQSCTALKKGNLELFGELMHASWLQKRHLVGRATNSFLDQCYARAREHGALGGRVTPAGCGHFLMLYCPPERQPAVEAALFPLGLQRQTFKLEDQGVQIMEAVAWPQFSYTVQADEPETRKEWTLSTPAQNISVHIAAERRIVEPVAYGGAS